MHDHADPGHDHSHADAAGAQMQDPVCGMTVDAKTAKHRHTHNGKTHFFCCAGCLDKFRYDADAFLAAPREAPDTPSEAPADAIYTCPMHPEIERDDPGDCPICGMALEPKTVAAGRRRRAPSAGHGTAL